MFAEEAPPVDQSSLHQEAHDIWNQNAAFWDEFTGEGTSWHTQLLGPAVDRLLQLKPGEQVLDVACGNGNFARRMAQQGAYVTACDFSEVFLERARARTTEHGERIDYRLIDATNEAQLFSLGTRRFDAAHCGMALQDMTSIDPLLSSLSQLLKSTGRFVFSVMHPCFNAAGVKMVMEEEDKEGDIITVYTVKVSRYLGLTPRKGLGIIGQPTPQYYFDRPLSVLFNACFRAGWVLNGLEEPAFAESHGSSRPLGWSGKFKEIPPVLVARCVLSSSRER
jgi:2-polyprenyl-3-methyl-5-hydroxy-6-metoxy-1,4-benzoquinol methylase